MNDDEWMEGRKEGTDGRTSERMNDGWKEGRKGRQ